LVRYAFPQIHVHIKLWSPKRWTGESTLPNLFENQGDKNEKDQ
jgi:hypothetical protein